MYRDLAQAHAAAPGRWLGEASLAAFGPRLPFLMKVLAADRALSLQVHPNREQAEAGFAAEEATGAPAPGFIAHSDCIKWRSTRRGRRATGRFS